MIEAGLPAARPLQVVVDLALPDPVAVVAVSGMRRVVVRPVAIVHHSLIVIACRVARRARIRKESRAWQCFRRIGMPCLCFIFC